MASDARELAQRVEELEAQLAQLVLVASGPAATAFGNDADLLRLHEAKEVLQLQLEKEREKAAASSKKLKLCVLAAADVEERRAAVAQSLREAQERLVSEFEAKAEALYARYEEFQEPQEQALDAVVAFAAEQLEGRFAQIITPHCLLDPLFQEYIARKLPQPQTRAAASSSSSAAAVGGSQASAVPIPVPAPSPPTPSPVESGSLNSPGLFSPMLQGSFMSPAALARPAAPSRRAGAGRSARPGSGAADGATDDADAPSASAAASDAELVVARRRRLARASLLSIFPSMSEAEAVALLERAGDRIEQAIVEGLRVTAAKPAPAPSQAMDVPDSGGRGGEVVAASTAAPSAPAVPGAAGPSKTPPRPQSGGAGAPSANASQAQRAAADALFADAQRTQGWLASLPRVVVSVDRVTPELEVEFRLVLDRNGLPAHEGAPPQIVSLSDLYALNCHVLTEGEAARLKEHVRTKVPVITFSPVGEESFELRSVKPRMPLSQYQFQYDPIQRQIVAVVHERDGPVRFTAYDPQTLPSTARVSSVFDTFVLVYTAQPPAAQRGLLLLELRLPDDLHAQPEALALAAGQSLEHVVTARPERPLRAKLLIAVSEQRVAACALQRPERPEQLQPVFFIEQRVGPVGSLVQVTGAFDGNASGAAAAAQESDASWEFGPQTLARVSGFQGGALVVEVAPRDTKEEENDDDDDDDDEAAEGEREEQEGRDEEQKEKRQAAATRGPVSARAAATALSPKRRGERVLLNAGALGSVLLSVLVERGEPLAFARALAVPPSQVQPATETVLKDFDAALHSIASGR